MDNSPLASNKKEDLRITKTKSALQEAFFSLISEKPFNDITVNELCDRAGVRRATFYKHFSDKYDFLGRITAMLREDFDLKMKKAGSLDFTVDYYLEYVYALVEFLCTHETAVDMIMRSEGSHYLINIIVEQNFIDTKQRLDRTLAEGGTLPAGSDTLASIITGGVGQAIYRWYKAGKPVPPVRLAADIVTVIRKILR